MADTYVQVPPDSTGKKIETQEVTEDGGTVVERQVIAVADLAAVLYELVQTLQHPMTIEYITGRQRVSIEAIGSAVTIAISAFAGAVPRDVMTFQLDRINWAQNVGSRVL